MHIYEVLRRPLITEKSTALQAMNKYAFEVADGANKPMVKQAVEKAFKVTVTGVNVVTMRGKTRRMGRREITTNPWKKAVVTLKAGDKIEFLTETVNCSIAASISYLGGCFAIIIPDVMNTIKHNAILTMFNVAFFQFFTQGIISMNSIVNNHRVIPVIAKAIIQAA